MGFKMKGSPFKVRKTEEGLALKRWFKEEWKTPKGNEDYSKGENTFRPTKKISKEKNTKGRVSRYKKKK
jgi:hypothetical protein